MLGNLRKTTTRHHGRDVVWSETSRRLGAIVDGLAVSITKMHPTTFQPSRGGRAAKPNAPRYRVCCDTIFVQPHWGFRRTLKQAKDDGVARAIEVSAQMRAAKASIRKSESS